MYRRDYRRHRSGADGLLFSPSSMHDPRLSRDRHLGHKYVLYLYHSINF